MDREVCNATNPIIKKLLIPIETNTPELLFLKKYSPYSEIYRNYQKTLKSTTTYDYNHSPKTKNIHLIVDRILDS